MIFLSEDEFLRINPREIVSLSATFQSIQPFSLAVLQSHALMFNGVEMVVAPRRVLTE